MWGMELQMSFDDLYAHCFRDIPLVHITLSEKNEGNALTTIGHVINSSNYVIFFYGSGPKSRDLIEKLTQLAEKRNQRKTSEGSQSSPAKIRRFFGLKKKKKKREAEQVSEELRVDVSLIRLDCDADGSEVPAGWFVIAPLEDVRIRSRLLRALGMTSWPAVVVVDSSSRTLISQDGRRLIHDDPSGREFPWPLPSMDFVPKEGCDLVRQRDGKLEKCRMENAVVRALFFGAHWCPPCRSWVEEMSQVYSSLQDKESISFEMIFCSSDRTEQVFNSFIELMPWPSLPYDPARTIALTRIFGVQGIPSVVLIDEDNEVLTRHGRSVLLEDREGMFFPWKPRAIYELTEHSIFRLREMPSLILFTEGSEDDVAFSKSVLEESGQQLLAEREKRLEREEREKEKRPPLTPSTSSDECASTDSEVCHSFPIDGLQLFFTGDDPVCDHILERILGLADVELPVVVIMDGLLNVFAVCEGEEVSKPVVDSFIDSFKEGRLSWKRLPTETGSVRPANTNFATPPQSWPSEVAT